MMSDVDRTVFVFFLRFTEEFREHYGQRALRVLRLLVRETSATMIR